jgi:hypothetical protein
VALAFIGEAILLPGGVAEGDVQAAKREPRDIDNPKVITIENIRSRENFFESMNLKLFK